MKVAKTGYCSVRNIPIFPTSTFAHIPWAPFFYDNHKLFVEKSQSKVMKCIVLLVDSIHTVCWKTRKVQFFYIKTFFFCLTIPPDFSWQIIRFRKQHLLCSVNLACVTCLPFFVFVWITQHLIVKQRRLTVSHLRQY